jgi:hypothetical protein
MKEFLNRLAEKLSGFKALFTIAVLALLVFHPFTATNASVLTNLIYAVLGAKAVQYVTGAAMAVKGKD